MNISQNVSGAALASHHATSPSKPSDDEVSKFEQAFGMVHPGVLAQPHTPSQSQVPASAPPPAQLDQLIAQYVQLLAVSEPSAGDPRVMLKLDPSLLPNTELFLAKSAEGWVLQANARSPDAAQFIAEHGPALERRFRDKRLGSLRIETTSATLEASRP